MALWGAPLIGEAGGMKFAFPCLPWRSILILHHLRSSSLSRFSQTPHDRISLVLTGGKPESTERTECNRMSPGGIDPSRMFRFVCRRSGDRRVRLPSLMIYGTRDFHASSRREREGGKINKNLKIPRVSSSARGPFTSRGTPSRKLIIPILIRH